MPKGPRGEKRPADTNACAVTVGKIATGELEDKKYKNPRRKLSGEAGAAARKAALSANTRKEIATAAANARWRGKETVMSEKQRLMKSLFEQKNRKLVNLKFLRGPKSKVTEEEFCAEVNEILFAIDNGLTVPTDTFPETPKKEIDLKEFAKQFD